MPVPRVRTSSVPAPSITASPWTPASLAMRTGLPVSFSRALPRSNPSQAGSRFGAVSVRPLTTTPGKPAATRSKWGIWATISLTTTSTALGVAGCGVSMRTRSLISRSAASAVNPLIPVPPMSRQKVINPVFFIPAPSRSGRRRDYVIRKGVSAEAQASRLDSRPGRGLLLEAAGGADHVVVAVELGGADEDDEQRADLVGIATRGAEDVDVDPRAGAVAGDVEGDVEALAGLSDARVESSLDGPLGLAGVAGGPLGEGGHGGEDEQERGDEADLLGHEGPPLKSRSG